jgi:nucleotide-binding universal stress UspA family protein
MSEQNKSIDGTPADVAETTIQEGPVLLALSTFRRSHEALEAALQKATGSVRRLVILFVVDENLARYFIGTDLGLYPGLKQQCEQSMLEDHTRQAHRRVQQIEQEARDRGLEVTSYVRAGRFAHACIDIIERENPSIIVTTRSDRPKWVKRFFGSPVDHLMEHADCPVIAV